ncbi:MAG: 30S ribosomal protein S16 [bacterium]|nr:30S ribosomal protein S16 [bacterium]
MLVIRLQRTGRRNAPAYRIVAAEKTSPVKGKFVEMLGHYVPKHNPIEIKFNEERIRTLISNGAVPSNTVARLLSKQGMKGLDKFVARYSKQKKRNPSAEEAAPPPAPEAPKEERAEAPKEEPTKDAAPLEETPKEETPPETEEGPSDAPLSNPSVADKMATSDDNPEGAMDDRGDKPEKE